jgi:tetratricopeptide (TPR) repeat protein
MRGRSRRNPAIIRLAWISGTVVVLALVLFAVARVKPDPDQLWLSVQEDWKAGRFDRAQAAMDQLLRLRPATDEHDMVLAQLAMARGRDAEALGHLARIGDGSPAAARARTLEGRIELRNRRARRAEAAFLRAVRLDPDDPVLRRDLILLYCMQRRRRELSEQFAALSRLTPLDFNQMLLWSSSLAASWDPSETAPIMEGFVKADPDDHLSRLTLAEAFRRLQRIDDVKAVLSPLPSSDPEVRAILARIAEARGDTGEVERLTGDDADRHPVLARMHASLDLSRGEPRTAIKHLRAAAAADPHNRAVLYQLGDTLIRLGDVDEGRRYVSASKQHDALYDLLERVEEPGARDDARMLAQVAGASHRVGLRAEARNWYLLALRLDPTEAEIQKALYRLDHEGSAPLAGAPLRATRNPHEPGRPGGP